MHDVSHLNTTDPRAFNLDEEMIKRLSEEFDLVKAAASFSRQVKEAGGEETQERAREFFGGFGRRLMLRSIEEGEAHPDLTYVNMKEYLEKTGMGPFPLVVQRYVEIANLCALPIRELNVRQSNREKLVYVVSGCAVYEKLRGELGEERAGRLPCRFACLAMCDTALERLGVPGKTSMDSSQLQDGACKFSLAVK